MKKKYYLTILLSLISISGVFSQPNTKSATQVGPLLGTINWNQDAPYNNMCPMVEKSLGKMVRAYVGCGATAAGQVMKYYGFPAKGQGKVTNSGETFDLSAATYNWNKMLVTYPTSTSGTTEERNEVAKLSRHVGAAMNMIYNPTGSGSSLSNIRASLSTNFGYKGTSNIIYREAYTDDEWFEVIKREIDHGRPVPYAGNDDANGGHLFICDGYDASNKTLHFNYGWNGRDNAWTTISENRFYKQNSALIGLHPVSSQIDPTIVMFTPMNFSNYTATRGGKFNTGVRVSNYGFVGFNNEVAVALYKGDTLVEILKTMRLTLSATNPETGGDSKPIISDLLFTDVVIPSTIPEGDYQLRLLAKSESGNWCLTQGLVKSVTKETNIKVSKAGLDITYPLGSEQIELVLTAPIEINVANNRAIARFSIKNTDLEYDCIDADIYVVASPNNKLIPATWKKITVNIPSGMTGDFEISEIQIPAGADVKSCRFSVAYNRILPKLNSILDKEREVASVPLLPARFNLREYQIPNEVTSFSINFSKAGGVTIPANYKMYYADGQEDVERKTWGTHFLMGNATLLAIYAKLVTSAIEVRDENEVLEWQLGNAYSQPCTYRIYISTNGQDYKYFKDLKPAFDEKLPNDAVARLSLSDYAGKNVYIMFESVDQMVQFELTYFKVINIKSPKDISLQSINIPGSVISGEGLPVKFSVKNNSAVNVKRLTATYTIAGMEPVTEEIDTDIPFNQTKELAFSKRIFVTGKAGEITHIDVHVKQEGEAPDAMGNNNGSSKFMIVNFYPRKSIIVFKSSKAGCPACMNSYSAIDDVDKLFPEASTGVEVWKDGSFKDSGFSEYLSSATPTFYLNGKSIPEYTSSGVPVAARKLYQTLNPPAEISVQADYENAESRKLKIRIKSRFAMPLTGTYRLGAFIIENNVINIDGQISGTHPTGVKLTKNHIPVGTVGGCKGNEGFSISNPTTKEEYVYECEYTIPEEIKNDKGIYYRYRKDNIQVVGVLFNSTGEILNTSLNNYYIHLPKTAGLTFIAEESYCPFKSVYEVESTGKDEFISLDNLRSTIPADGSFKFRIQKDSSWEGKNVRLVINPDAVYNQNGSVRKEQVLLSDADGIYTIDNVSMNYYMRIDVVPEGGPMLSKDGSQLLMSGQWTADDFKKLDVSLPSLTGLDMTNITVPDNAPAINISNPNMLIYTVADATVPTTWKNVVKGSASENIALKDGYPFFNTKEFTASSITYTRNYPFTGWASGCLPFTVSSIPESIRAERFSDSKGTEVQFTGINALEANTPYIFNITTEGEKTFAAANAIIPVTTLTKVEKGEYAFEGTFKIMKGTDVAGLYMMHHDGTGFRRATATNDIPAFRSFIRYTGTNHVPQLNISHKEEETVIENETTGKNNSLIIHFSGNILEIIATKAQQVDIYSLDGRRISILNLSEGINTINGLPQGLYIMGNQKVAIR